MVMGVSAADDATAGKFDSDGADVEELAMPLEEEAAAGGATDRELVSRGEGGEEGGGESGGGGGCAAPSKVETTASTGARVSWAARQGVHTRRRSP